MVRRPALAIALLADLALVATAGPVSAIDVVDGQNVRIALKAPYDAAKIDPANASGL